MCAVRAGRTKQSAAESAEDLADESDRSRNKKRRPRDFFRNRGAVKPAFTYSRPIRTTIGRAALTSEFGKGSGVAPHVWTPADRVRMSEPVLSGSLIRLHSNQCERESQGTNHDSELEDDAAALSKLQMLSES